MPKGRSPIAASSDAGWLIRDFDAARDAGPVGSLDTSYETDTIYAVRAENDSLILERMSAHAIERRHFPIDLAADRWSHALVATQAGAVRGFVAWAIESWNRRMTIWHFYVDAPYRRQGAGRELIDVAIDRARRADALTAWVETSATNHPGITAYRRLGFEICGFDRTLYRGTSNEGDIAVFMARAIPCKSATPSTAQT